MFDFSKLNCSDYKEYHTDMTVKFLVQLPAQTLTQLERSNQLHKQFKLQSVRKSFLPDFLFTGKKISLCIDLVLQVINTTSMVLFDADGVLRRYNSPEEILADFVVTRRKFYLKRKQFLLGMLKAEADRLSNQVQHSYNYWLCIIK